MMLNLGCRRHVALACVMFSVAAPVAAAGQASALKAATALYDSAAYDEALAMLGEMNDVEALQYRALCLLALGRPDDARQAIQQLVRTSPWFMPPGDVPPRFLSMFHEIRILLLPELVRKEFVDGREHFDAMDDEVALRQFQQVLLLTADAGDALDPGTRELRLLASDFTDLITLRSRPREANEEAPLPPSPGGRVDDRGAIIAVLNQYSLAYRELNAAAARVVWPSLDERALARAFASLDSQSIAFDACDIDVHGTAALASCRGHASYVGKIGTRSAHTERRTWQFRFKLTGDTWKIESAESRRVLD